jgi:hypothetical protein
LRIKNLGFRDDVDDDSGHAREATRAPSLRDSLPGFTPPVSTS